MRDQKNLGIQLSKDQLDLIEAIGVFASERGLQPAPSRIYALLLVADTIELTFDEIRFTLGYSKSATSNGLNQLLENRRIKYITKTGDRKRYFRSNVEMWKEALSDDFNYLDQYCELLEEVLKVRTKDTPSFNESIIDLKSFLEFAKDELSNLYNRWDQIRNNIDNDKV